MVKSIIETALQFYGEKEVDGPGSNPVILEIIQTMAPWIKDDGKISWCAIFINHVAKLSGHEMSGKMTARSFLTLGKSVRIEEARPGDVVIYWRESRDSWKGHVNLFINYKPGEYIRGLGGNQSNGVNIRRYGLEKILDIRRLGVNDL